MPTSVISGYKFRFYSSDFGEPPHVHVLRDDNEAKVWLNVVALEHSRGYNRVETDRILRLTEEHRDRLLEAWHGYFDRSAR